MVNISQWIFPLTFAVRQYNVTFDYTPTWTEGNEYAINTLSFPKVFTGQAYQYRVIGNRKDLGVRSAYEVSPDGSQILNFLDWTGGYGLPKRNIITVYAVDPTTRAEFKIAERAAGF